jgi:signal transduction histidine kinase
MAEQHADAPTPPGDEMMWATHYVRDAIQELRQDVRALREELREELRSEIASVRSEIADLRRESNNRFLWLIGIMVTLAGMQSALMVALLRMQG